MTLFFIAFFKGSKHNYQLDQVLENFKYSFYFDGITLKCYYDQKITFIFSSDFEAMFIKHSASEIISLNFEKKAVNLNCNFPF